MTGIPGMGYILTGFFLVILAVITVLVVRKFFVVTLIALIYGFLISPTNLLGPPGFYKMIMLLIIGLIADTVIFLFKYKKIGYYFTFLIANLVSLPIWILMLKLLGLPGIKEILSFIWIYAAIYAIQGLVGAWIGIKLYEKKLKNKRIIKQISR